MSNDLKQIREYVKMVRQTRLTTLQTLLNDIYNGDTKQSDETYLSEQLYITELHLLDNILDKIDDVEYGEHSNPGK